MAKTAKPKAMTVKEFFKKFPDDDACLEHLMAVRFGKEFTCPKCERMAKWYRLTGQPAYTCEWCGHHVHPMVGTPFLRTRTALQKWFFAIYLFTMSRHGVPAKELQRQLGVTYKTAWRMGHEIRKYMAVVDGDGVLGGHVEVDETYLGGRVRGKGRGLKLENKAIIVGMVERGGEVIMRHMDKLRKRAVHTMIRQNVKLGTTMSADEHLIYDDLDGRGYRVGRINHSQDEWKRGVTHTNTIEGVWSMIKRCIRGTHINVSRKHLHKYLAEFEYRWNMRKRPDLMLDRLLQSF